MRARPSLHMTLEGSTRRDRLKQRLRQFVVDLTESDEARYAKELRAWADSIPGTVRIAQAPLRTRVRMAGEVRRITIHPRRPESGESYEVALYDGTGEIRVIWVGRKRIPGVTLGSRILVDGLVDEEHGVRQAIDPKVRGLSSEPHDGREGRKASDEAAA